MTDSRPSRPRVQLWMLRLMIAILLTGLPGALLPEIAFQKFAWLMGYGKQPITPLIVYLSGNAGFAYVTIAVLIWAISRDLTRSHALPAARAPVRLDHGRRRSGLPLH